MNISRRDFLKTTSAASTLAMCGGVSNLFENTLKADSTSDNKLIWSALLHLSYNMWSDIPVNSWGNTPKEELSWVCRDEKLRFDYSLWKDLTQKMSDIGMNQVVVDVGDGVLFESHPEISVKGAWSKEKLQKELARCRKLGLEPIPKLNFSTSHDTWLGEYARMVSTPKYYEVCADIIKETLEVFDGPRFLHLGYDEETYNHQEKYGYVVVRQGDIWWKDFLFFVKQVEKNGSRPWIWSDKYWHHKEEFLNKMPKSVLQSNWYYGESFDPTKINYVQTYLDLDKAGFDQIPTGSNWSCDTNFRGTVDFCTKYLNPKQLKGFLQTSWDPTLEAARPKHLQALEQVAASIKAFSR